MILSAQSIRQRCVTNLDQYGRLNMLLLYPFVERSVHKNGMSYGLSSAGYDIRLGRDVNIRPGGYALGSTIEQFQLPFDLLMRVHDKSTWARKGIFVQNTVGEPGWRGFLTLELSNDTSAWVHIEEGTPIAQVVFEQLDHPTDQPYVGKYQDQEAGPQPARLEKVTNNES